MAATMTHRRRDPDARARHRHQSTKTSRIVPALMNAWLQPDALTMPDDRPRAAGSRLRQLWPDRQDVSAV